MTKPVDRISKMSWIYISGAASLFFLILAVIMIFFSSSITSMGITKSIYYLVLIPVGLASAAFLFGALRSRAKYTGKTSYGNLELTGPVVIFLLVIIGGFYFATPDSEFFLTIRAVDSDNPEKILRDGTVMVDFGNQRLNKNLNENGEVVFAGISTGYIGKDIRIFPQVKGYRNKNNLVTIPDDKVIYLELQKQTDTTTIRGMVINESGNPVDSVLIDIESGLSSTTSGTNGTFLLIVPASQGETLLLTAIKNGRTGYREYITVQERGSIVIKFKDN